MQQTIDIRVKATGQRVDIYPNETIEVNMGGISLLNLADRTVSYTNSFKIPRTPNNEQLFEFASQPTRSNRPSIEVIITKGLFQKTATLKVKEFDGDYKCEVSYSTVFEILKNTKAFGIFGAKGVDTVVAYLSPSLPTDDLAISLTMPYAADQHFYFETNGFYVPSHNEDIEDWATDPKGFGIKFTHYLTQLKNTTGINFSGNIYQNADFLKLAIFNPYIKRVFVSHPVTPFMKIVRRVASDPNKSAVSCADIIKLLSQLFLLDVTEQNGTISLDIITSKLPNSGIIIENLKNTGKVFKTGFSKNNWIKYKIEDTDVVPLNFGADYFVSGDGDGDNDLIEVKCTIPKYVKQPLYVGETTPRVAADIHNEKASNNIYVGIVNTRVHSVAFEKYSGTYNGTGYAYSFEPLSLSPFYSSILNPIFANPVILSASGYIDPFTADSIMNTRIINSVKLGGRYWVDEMKYNLTTGNSVLKLIKLP
jgi:hypothetical protein